jgi:hypothetical protein
VTVGRNASALVPALDTASGTVVLIPALGGPQQAGTTNGTDSNLIIVPAFGGFGRPTIALTGDTAGSVSSAGTYDIRGVAVSEDGATYLLTGTYNSGYNTLWRLYKTTINAILSATAKTPLSAAAFLQPVDSTADTINGDPGNYWEVQYENNATPANGRLWFVKGSPIRISLGGNYAAFKLIDAGSGGSLYSPAFNVNSADLIGEMIYQAGKGVSKDTRLIKGSAQKSAARTAASTATQEEEEK